MIDGETLKVSLENHVPGIEMFYTIDNTYPVKFGHKYENPISIPKADVHLRIQSYRNGDPLGRLIILSRKEMEQRAK
jgi:hexosaminidase